mmetsp:Transcript_58968/g.172613  ORF Transcript_58968/g.172613 Transcript_58968/m.172613 type:complete len:234 (+) Transcript_58968:72-773(+)
MASPAPRGALIFLHGSGGSGAEVRQWLDVAGKGKLEKQLAEAGVSLIFPDAPVVAYTLCEGELTAVWFDRKEMSYDDPEDTMGVERSVLQIDSEIDRLVDAGVSLDHIYVGGMSMGGCLALHVAYGRGKYAGQLAGAICFSGFLPADSCLDALAAARFKGPGAVPAPPLLMAHGGCDLLVNLSWAKRTRTRLLDAGVPIPEDLTMFPHIGHDICEWEIDDLVEFIIKRPAVNG